MEPLVGEKWTIHYDSNPYMAKYLKIGLNNSKM
jgi:hypothetical protein